VRVFFLFRRLNPVLAIAFAAALVLLFIVFAFRTLRHKADRRTLRAPVAPPPGDTDFHRLRTYARFLVHYLKRLADHPALPADARQRLRQQAYDLDDVIHAHPLADDLARAISKTRIEFLDPTLVDIRRAAVELARARMKSVVQDVIEPPFPVLHGFVVFYHQFMMICSIVDRHLAGPALFEYYTVIRDTVRVITRGAFLRIGQHLFEGVYANSPPMGQGAEDFGEALTSIWLTVSVAEAAMHRCSSLTAWTVEDAIEHLDRRTVEFLKITREELVREVMPLLKLRFRHSVPPGVADAAGFSDALSGGIEKAIDMVVQGLRAQPPEKTAQDSRRTQAIDLGPFRADAQADDPPGNPRRRVRSSSAPRRGVMGMLRTFGQRIQYGVMGRRLHR
jgi:hypothetical protein